jgi:dsDNA-specific endonuclease/ATPase MutS2
MLLTKLKQFLTKTVQQSEIEAETAEPFSDPVEIEITDVFDLHTIQPREVKPVVEEYLFQARQKGFRSVRIIHGKGIGVQRELVRSVLERTPFVVSFTDAPPEAGGWGATVAHLTVSGS